MPRNFPKTLLNNSLFVRSVSCEFTVKFEFSVAFDLNLGIQCDINLTQTYPTSKFPGSLPGCYLEITQLVGTVIQRSLTRKLCKCAVSVCLCTTALLL